MFSSVAAFASIRISSFVSHLSIKPWYPSSGHLYYSKRTPLNVKQTSRVSLFITLFILLCDNNNKNNRPDLNGSKENINIVLLHWVFLDSRTARQLPEEGSLNLCVLCLRMYGRVWKRCVFICQWENLKGLLKAHIYIPLLLVRMHCCYLLEKAIFYVTVIVGFSILWVSFF